MRAASRHEGINAWWDGNAGERYWLDVTNRDGRDQHLAAPRGDRTGSDSWAGRLIQHVRAGEIVFHYDAARRAIVAWSLAHGRVRKQRLTWPARETAAGYLAASRDLPSWGIRLRQPLRLGAEVPLEEIARAQWNLFPALRALEDRVGHPLHYPFEMGNREDTKPLPGYVFKLPAVLVEGVPELASVAGCVARLLPDAARDSHRRTAPAPRPYATAW